VILVMVDTLRADHLSCYGYQASQSPNIDGLAADGIRFGRAYAQASWTRPSVATILSSLYPSSHQAVHKSDILPDAVVTLPEVLQASGYRTVGFANNINVAPLFNFQQGFDEYEFLEPEFFFGATEAAAQLTIYNQLRLIRERYLSDAKYVQHYYQPAEVVTDRALTWIEANGAQPFFMFLHYMDPHDPYFTHPYDGEAFARVANPNPDPSLADAYRKAYDGEIRHLDEHFGRLLKTLRDKGLYDRIAIVLTADHGEEFHEHGGWWHGLTLYDEQIAVPLIVKAPQATGGELGAASQSLVSSLDIAPTILTLTGVPIPETMQGAALGLTAAATPPRDHAFSEQDLEGNVLRAYQRGGWKVIDANPGNPRGLPARQLFEIDEDRGEQQDLASQETDRAEHLTADLDAVQTHARTLAVESSETAIDGATQERLRALGYVH
jgi:arylsulfatase A-like enzyme